MLEAFNFKSVSSAFFVRVLFTGVGVAFRVWLPIIVVCAGRCFFGCACRFGLSVVCVFHGLFVTVFWRAISVGGYWVIEVIVVLS